MHDVTQLLCGIVIFAGGALLGAWVMRRRHRKALDDDDTPKALLNKLNEDARGRNLDGG